MNWLSLVMGILAGIPALVQAVETIIGTGNGAAKRSAVVSVATQTATVAGATPTQVAAVSAAAGTIVDATVASFNAVGTFKHGAIGTV